MSYKKYMFENSQFQEEIEGAVQSKNDGGKEICGLMIDNGYFLELIRTRNKIKRGGGFAFYRTEIRNIQSAVNILGHEIVGTYHSHPLYIAKPGKGDIDNALDDSLMLVIDATDKKASLWHIINNEATELNYSLIS